MADSSHSEPSHSETAPPRRRLAIPTRVGSLLRRPDWSFLALAVPFGLAYALLTPPMQFADEGINFLRAVQLSTGTVLGEKWQTANGHWTAGGPLPRAVAELNRATRHLPRRPHAKISRAEILALFEQDVDPADEVQAKFARTVLYSPVPYLPQSLGIAVGRAFDAPPVALLYLARLFGLAFCIGLNFFAIRTTPLAPWAFFVFALFPLGAYHMSGCVADGVTAGLSRLALAATLRAAATAAPVGTGRLLWLGLLGAAVALCKQTYFLIAGMIFFLRPQQLGGGRRYWLAAGGVLVASLTPWAVWAVLASSLSTPELLRPSLDPNAQAAFVATHPLEFMQIFLRWAFVKLPDIMLDTGNSLGWLDVPLPDWILYASTTAVVVAMLLDRNDALRIVLPQRVLAAGITAATLGGTALALYIWWTPPGTLTIQGVHARHLFPVLPLLFVVAGNAPMPQALVRGFQRAVWLLPVLALIENGIGVSRLVERYFGA